MMGTVDKCAFCVDAPTVRANWLDSTGHRIVSTNYYCDDHEYAAYNWSGPKNVGAVLA